MAMTGGPPAPNPLSSQSISGFMAASLGDESSIQTPYDAIALCAHSCMLAVGFRLVGLDEDHRIEAHSDENKPLPLPLEWNAHSGSYAFRYRHTQSSMEYLVKVNRMGNKAVVMGMGLGDDKTCTFDVKVQDFVSEGNLPVHARDKEQVVRKLADAFINMGRLSDLGSLMRLNVVQKLVPALHKSGYEETREAQQQTTRQQERQRDDRTQPDLDPLRDTREPPHRPYPMQDPLAHPRRPMPDPMPGFDDEFETQRGPRPFPGGRAPGYGERDLYPQGLGPRDPLRGGVGPGLGRMGGGGMHPTFDDEMFAGQGQGGGMFDPRNPPGSRYDPAGPYDGTGPGHPRGAGMGGRPPNPFGGFGGGDFI